MSLAVKIHAILLLFLGTAHAVDLGAEVRIGCNGDELLLIREGYSLEEFRTGQGVKLWRQYKNAPRAVPQTWDLGQEALHPKDVVVDIPPGLGIYAPKVPTISSYERSVLLLKKGDRVRFDDQIFVLGDFLGAGNATHVYEIRDEQGRDTGTVLRLPFLSRAIYHAATPGKSTAEHRYEVLSFLAQLHNQALSARKYLGAVWIKADPRGRFAVAQRIYGKQNGRQYLESLERKKKFSTGLTLLTLPQMVNETDRTKLLGLLELMEKNQDVRRRAQYWYLTEFVPARQYLFSEREQRWYLVDADSGMRESL